jgi:peptide/nickel transport system ATP-binding protein
VTATVAEVRDLAVHFPLGGDWLRAVDGVTFDIGASETLGLVGESGCGKTVTALSMMGLVPPPGLVRSGTVRIAGRSMHGADDARRIRGGEVGMVFQEPMTSLHPAITVGRQVAEALLAHAPNLSKAGARTRAIELLEEVGIPDPSARSVEFPHTWSGGMRQRAMIAMAVANRPRLLIADEPTTALDVTVQAQILALLRRLRDENGMALLLITHDLGVVAEMADRVAVMYAGRIVEEGSAASIFARPRHPYTRGLMDSRLRVDRIGTVVPAIRGRPPRVYGTRTGCAFAPRCDVAVETCRTDDPAPAPVAGGGSCACFVDDRREVRRTATVTVERRPGERELLRVEGLVVGYATRQRSPLRSRTRVRAVDGVSFRIHEGETLALVGESGCGKTTTAKAVLGLLDTDAGTVEVVGVDIGSPKARRSRAWRRTIQSVFQDVGGALNPRASVFDIVAAPLRVNRLWDERAGERVFRTLEQVGLDHHLASSRPAGLSGGQRQRVGIARALILEPKVVILDEPVSALDVSIQAQILGLLAELRDQLGLSYLFITHDLAVVAALADRVAIMYLGEIVETGSTADVLERPAHPYTRALLASVPVSDPTARDARPAPLAGDTPTLVDVPAGCRFRTRCPIAQPACAEERPRLEGGDHRSACLFPHLGAAR